MDLLIDKDMNLNIMMKTMTMRMMRFAIMKKILLIKIKRSI